jgi:hypothetical protein
MLLPQHERLLHPPWMKGRKAHGRAALVKVGSA